MNVIEGKIKQIRLSIEPLGNAWAVYSHQEGQFEREQEDVFSTLDQARAFVKKRRFVRG